MLNTLTFYDGEINFLYPIHKSQNLLKLKFLKYYLTYIDKKHYRNNCFEYFGTGTPYKCHSEQLHIPIGLELIFLRPLLKLQRLY